MIAFFGGTFDPIHRGHLHLAKSLQETFSFDRFFLVPNAQNPLKKAATEPKLRLEMVKKAISGLNDERFEVLDWEVLEPPPSYTISTIKRIQDEFEEEVTLVLGNDVFCDLARWHKPKELANLVNFLIVQRTGEPIDVAATFQSIGLSLKETGEKLWEINESDRSVSVFTFQPLPYRATDIRKSIAEMWQKEQMETVPPGIEDSVWAFIKENQIYTVS